MAEPVLSLKGVSIKRGSEQVLAGLSLDVFSGEAIGIRGANGAGKTTLLKLMAGLLKPDAGTRTESPSLSCGIAYVPQEIALYQTLTCRQNLDFWAEAYGLSGRPKRARIDYLLNETGLTEKADKRVETCSGGMQRRLNLACALVKTPKLLLLDEPTVGADADSVKRMLSLVSRMKGSGTAIVLVSHIDDELKLSCERVLTLDNGVLK